jgi:hypothetical protein
MRNSYSHPIVEPDMPARDLLPGVTTRSCPPRVVCDARAAIRAAKRRAYLRDGLQITLLVAVDYLFIHWPDSRMPFLDRGSSLDFLRAVNAVAVADLWLTRALPKWWAKRIAHTWSRTERDRFTR